MSEYLMAAANARAYITAMSISAGKPVGSVLICDNRTHARDDLSDMLLSVRPAVTVRCVADGFALVDAHAARPADLVLVGIHGGNLIGAEAVTLQRSMYPETPVLVIGSKADLTVLIAAYCRGAQGMLIWDPD